MTVNPGIANAMLAVLATACDAGPGVATLHLYNGIPPSPGGAASHLLLAYIPLPKPLAATIANGQITVAAITPALASASGTATWARVLDGYGVWAMDGPVTDLAGDGFIQLVTGTQLTAGGLVIVTAGAISIL